MPSFDTYLSQEFESRTEDVIVNVEVVNFEMIITRKSGQTENLGSVRGPQGPEGIPGDLTMAEFEAYVDMIWGPWIDIPLATNWTHATYTGNWAKPRFRRWGGRVELDGLVVYTGPTITSGLSTITSGIPSEFRPITSLMLSGVSSTQLAGDIRAHDAPESLVIYSWTNPNRPIPQNGWWSLTGMSWPLKEFS
jgi:hypothetical protein